MIRRVPEIFPILCVDRITGAFFQVLPLLCVPGEPFQSPPHCPPRSLPVLMDEGFEVLTAAGICVGKRGDIQRIIKRKNQLTLKKNKRDRVGEIAGTHREMGVCVYKYI